MPNELAHISILLEDIQTRTHTYMSIVHTHIYMQNKYNRPSWTDQIKRGHIVSYLQDTHT